MTKATALSIARRRQLRGKRGSAQRSLRSRLAESGGPDRAGEAGRRHRGAGHEQLLHRDAARIARARLHRHQHQQRHDHRARPVRHLAEMEREPARQMHDLDRHHRHVAPVHLAEERQLDAGEDVDAAGAAMGEDRVARARHVRRVRRIAHRLQGEIGLHRRRDIEVAAVEQRPAAMLALDRAKVMGERLLLALVDLVEIVLQQDVLGGDGGVRLQLEHPMPVRALLRDAAPPRPRRWRGRAHPPALRRYGQGSLDAAMDLIGRSNLGMGVDAGATMASAGPGLKCFVPAAGPAPPLPRSPSGSPPRWWRGARYRSSRRPARDCSSASWCRDGG